MVEATDVLEDSGPTQEGGEGPRAMVDDPRPPLLIGTIPGTEAHALPLPGLGPMLWVTPLLPLLPLLTTLSAVQVSEEGAGALASSTVAEV